jgi:hypothetical protein
MRYNGNGVASYVIDNPGSGYVDGTYSDVNTTVIAGPSLESVPKVTITVVGGAVTAAAVSDVGTSPRGVGVELNQTLTVSNTLLGGSGSGLVIRPATKVVPSGNVGVGYLALQRGHGVNNTAVGYEAMQAASSALSCTAVGYRALYVNSTGISNAALGTSALAANTTGTENTATGAFAAPANTTGSSNVAVGYSALNANTTSSNNTAVGRNALVASTGGTNTALGYLALSNVTTGSNCTGIGQGVQASSATATNEVTLGNASVTTLRCNAIAITALSDARDKTDVSDLEVGLDLVNALRPVKFTWNARDGSKVGLQEAGFLAQDVQAAQGDDTYLQLVLDSNPDRLELTQGRLIPILVKAIQELSAEVAALKAAK